jgi:Ca2+-binding EF-hand superfamily protein
MEEQKKNLELSTFIYQEVKKRFPYYDQGKKGYLTFHETKSFYLDAMNLMKMLKAHGHLEWEIKPFTDKEFQLIFNEMNKSEKIWVNDMTYIIKRMLQRDTIKI